MKRLNREKTPTDLGYEMIDDHIAKLTKLREVANTDEFRAIANILESAERGCGKPGISIASWTGDRSSWNFSVYLSGLNSFADVLPLVSNVTALEADEYEVKEYPDTNNNDYKWVFKYEHEVDIRVTVCAYLDKSAPGACRRIQVGTELKEVPIYKNVCAPDLTDVSGELPPPILNLEAL